MSLIKLFLDGIYTYSAFQEIPEVFSASKSLIIDITGFPAGISHFNYLCNGDLYTPVHNVLEAWILGYSDFDVFLENERGSRVYRCKKLF
jgi:hypothetical protein